MSDFIEDALRKIRANSGENAYNRAVQRGSLAVGRNQERTLQVAEDMLRGDPALLRTAILDASNQAGGQTTDLLQNAEDLRARVDSANADREFTIKQYEQQREDQLAAARRARQDALISSILGGGLSLAGNLIGAKISAGGQTDAAKIYADAMKGAAKAYHPTSAAPSVDIKPLPPSAIEPSAPLIRSAPPAYPSPVGDIGIQGTDPWMTWQDIPDADRSRFLFQLLNSGRYEGNSYAF